MITHYPATSRIITNIPNVLISIIKHKDVTMEYVILPFYPDPNNKDTVLQPIRTFVKIVEVMDEYTAYFQTETVFSVPFPFTKADASEIPGMVTKSSQLFLDSFYESANIVNKMDIKPRKEYSVSASAHATLYAQLVSP